MTEFRHWSRLFTLLLPLFLSGCAVSRMSEVNTPLVNLPDGGQIMIQTLHVSDSSLGPGKGPLAVWKHPDGQEKVMVTLVPAPGSPGGVLRIDNSSPHFSADGNRVWLVRDGQTVASFDDASDIAVLGPAGQPTWANPAEGQPGPAGPVPPGASGTRIVPR